MGRERQEESVAKKGKDGRLEENYLSVDCQFVSNLIDTDEGFHKHRDAVYNFFTPFAVQRCMDYLKRKLSLCSH